MFIDDLLPSEERIEASGIRVQRRAFPKLWAFNLSWHERPERRIDSYAEPKGCLTKPGMPDHEGDHGAEYEGFPVLRTEP